CHRSRRPGSDPGHQQRCRDHGQEKEAFEVLPQGFHLQPHRLHPVQKGEA
ncbi:hypothetical protein AK812_SmicGene48105, partial [Symbiodinium microadriaticum]